MRFPVLAILMLVAAASTGSADDPSPLKVVNAARLTAPITVDGVLSEAVWQNSLAADVFLQRSPSEGQASSQRSEVRIAYDDEAIYVGARLYDTAPDSIIARLTRRDVSIPSDRFSIYLDPYHDKRSGYYFMVNAAGTMYDGTLSNDGWEDGSWDGVWQGKPKIDDQGWTLEMRIPYSQLRFQKSEHYEWGVNFRRVIPRRNEEDFLVFQPSKESGFVSRFPVLTGIQNVNPSRAIEFRPYATNKAEYLQHSPTDPFNDGSRYKPAVGGDLRMAVGSRLTLNATVNPDFGQVEVDPAVVNLSDVESYFQEKRPFFVEGSSNFNCGNQGASDYWGFNWPEPTFFYSRRIGRGPQGGVPSADYADIPVATHILGAAKLIGKLTPSVNFGTLHAITRREDARLDIGGVRSEAEIEPLTYYGVSRVLREFKDRKRGFGIMTTTAIRNSQDGRLRDQLNSQSYLAATDGWAFLDKNQTWVISGWSAISHVRGTTARMTALQQNSRHYFQRPDASHVEVDPDATSLTGFGSRYWLNKQKGSSFMNAALGFMNPQFDINDMGFQSRADVINGHAGGGYKWTTPTKHHKYQDVIGAMFGSYDFQGNPVALGLWGGGSTEFANNYSFDYKAAYNPQTVSPRRTRGGPLMLNQPGFELSTYFGTDGKQRLFYSLNASSYTQPSADSYNWNVSPSIEWKPISTLTLSAGPGYERQREDAQYLMKQTDPTATATYGSRNVVGTLDQTTFSANIRLNVAFTPNLSLQMFAQPLISAGRYSEIKELARPKSYDFNVYGTGGSTFDPATGAIDPDGPGPAQPFTLVNEDFGLVGNPDFNYKSLRGNAVLRWEYLPGSTLYLVWTQNRTDFENQGDFGFGPNLHQLTKAEPDNIFLAKVTYYFTM